MALFAESGIQVIAGAPALDAEAVARCFLEGSLVTGDNACSH
jgi:hypothetical protein